MVEGIIIAAGKSIRTRDKYKMTLDLSGKTVIERSIDSMSPFCEKIFVVTGFNSEKIKETIKEYKNIEIIYNENYEEGMFSSAKAGIKHVKAERFFFLPGDCPFVSHEVYEKMLKKSSQILVPSYNGRPGHPVFFHHGVIEKILKHNKYKSLREFIYGNKPEFLDVECQGILWDIDTIKDYENALQVFKREVKG